MSMWSYTCPRCETYHHCECSACQKRAAEQGKKNYAVANSTEYLNNIGERSIYTECTKCGLKADAMAYEHLQFLETASQEDWCPEAYTEEKRAHVKKCRDQYRKDMLAAAERGDIPDGITEDSLRQ